MLVGGNNHSSYMVNFNCTGPLGGGPTPPGCSLITALGAITASGVAEINTNWGMPWTTGMITAINKGTIGGQPQSTTLVAAGSNSRDALGLGNITLIAGGATHRQIANQDFSAIDIVTMNFAAAPEQ